MWICWGRFSFSFLPCLFLHPWLKMDTLSSIPRYHVQSTTTEFLGFLLFSFASRACLLPIIPTPISLDETRVSHLYYSNHSRMEVLGHRTAIDLTLWKLPNSFPKRPHHFTLSLATDGSHLSTSLPARQWQMRVTVCLYTAAILVDVEWYLLGFDFHFPKWLMTVSFFHMLVGYLCIFFRKMFV
jgi:hypothetical protein